MLLAVLLHGHQGGGVGGNALPRAQSGHQLFGQLAGVEQAVQIGTKDPILHTAFGGVNTLLERLADTDGMTEMKLLPSSFDGGEEFMSDELKKAVEGVGGTVSVKDLDETAGISLRVPKGGKAP